VPFSFNGKTQHQSTFTSKLVSFFSAKLVMIADFEHAAVHWEQGDSLSPYLLSDGLLTMFPLNERIIGPDGKTEVLKSSNNKELFQ
jgi:hypothetical protein